MSDWKTNREAQDSTAEWAIRHLRGVPKEERLDVLRMIIVNAKLDITPEELNRWCHRFEHPDIASGLAAKNVEGQAAAIEHRAVTVSAEAGEDEPGQADDHTASQHRAEGFRAFAELVVPDAGAVSWYYPADRREGAGYAKGKDGQRVCHMRYQTLSTGVQWHSLEGAGEVMLAGGERVAYLTSVTIGVKGGAAVWALPEVGPERVWEQRRHRTRTVKEGRREFVERRLAYHQRVIVHGGMNPKVIGVRAMALARVHSPGAVDNAEGASLARQLGLGSKQLLHYHQGAVDRAIQLRARRRDADGPVLAEA